MLTRFRSKIDKETLRQDATAGLVLGVQSVPDGLAGGLLAGVNPLFGLYAYLFGMVSAALVTSSAFMTVQATGAMAVVVADVGAVHTGENADRALFTLAILTGIVMLLAGFFKLGSILRFVSNAVMVGFISAVGVNIVLGQIADFTGYEAAGSGRLARALNTVLNAGSIDLQTITIGIATILMIVVLERTRLGSLGMVVAVVATSATVAIVGWDVAQLRDITDVPRGLPLPSLPLLSAVPGLIIPAISLAFVGLVQGAAITANFPNLDGTYPDASRDFVGQGVGNVVAGVFQGMPVGGSMSATALVTAAGSRTRAAQIIAGLVMVIVLLVFGDAVGYLAMPAIAGLLMLIGFRTVKLADILAVWKTGKVQAVVMTVTLALTIIVPLQFAVLVGVGISMILFVIRQSNDLVVKRFIFVDGVRREVEPPPTVDPNEVIMLQPYGSLFFASASVFEDHLPVVTAATHNSAVIMRLRGRTDLGSTLTEVLGRYAQSLAKAQSKLMIVSDSRRVLNQLEVAGVTTMIGSDNIYRSDEWVGRTLRRAYDDAAGWVGESSLGGSASPSPPPPDA